MAVSLMQAAKRLCERSDWTLTNLSLQKMMYISQMWHMGQCDGERLIKGGFQAWAYGPVSHDVYHHVKPFGSAPIRNVFHGVSDIKDQDDAEFLDALYDALADWTPGQLVSFTHRKGGAWDRYYEPDKRSVVIPDEAILQEYNEFYSQAPT